MLRSVLGGWHACVEPSLNRAVPACRVKMKAAGVVFLGTCIEQHLPGCNNCLLVSAVISYPDSALSFATFTALPAAAAEILVCSGLVVVDWQGGSHAMGQNLQSAVLSLSIFEQGELPWTWVRSRMSRCTSWLHGVALHFLCLKDGRGQVSLAFLKRLTLLYGSPRL